MKDIEIALRRAFPNHDIRSGQGRLMYIIDTDIAIGVAETGNEYEAKVVLLRGDFPLDCDTKLIGTLRSCSPEDLILQLRPYIDTPSGTEPPRKKIRNEGIDDDRPRQVH